MIGKAFPYFLWTVRQKLLCQVVVIISHPFKLIRMLYVHQCHHESFSLYNETSVFNVFLLYLDTIVFFWEEYSLQSLQKSWYLSCPTLIAPSQLTLDNIFFKFFIVTKVFSFTYPAGFSSILSFLILSSTGASRINSTFAFLGGGLFIGCVRF